MAFTCNSKTPKMFWMLLLFLRTAHGSNVVPNNPMANTVVPVDQPYNITWDPNDAITAKSVFIALENIGLATNLTVSTVNNGSYTWIPSAILGGQDHYYIQICPIDDNQDGCGVTYSGRFSIAAVSSSSSSSMSQSITTSSFFTTTSAYSTTLQSPSSMQTSTSSPQATASQTQSSGTKTKTSLGVSIGAVIAIAIVIPIFVIAIASITAFVLWKKYKAKQIIKEPLGSEGAATAREYRKAELPDASEAANRAGVYTGDNSGNSLQIHELAEARQ